MLKTNLPRKYPSPELRLAVLCAIDSLPYPARIQRIKALSKLEHKDPVTGNLHTFTWRTIQTWFSRYQKNGIATLESKVPKEKSRHNKVSVEALAEGIQTVLPNIKPNKVGRSLKSAVFRELFKQGIFARHQLGQTTFYRMVRNHDLLNHEACQKHRLSFAMKYANEMWQADTMYGPTLKDSDGRWKKTYLIAFIDDASRLITHAEWFFNDNTENMIHAFRCALYKRGKPERLYLDNGSNYKSSEIHRACLRLNIRLSHTPIRDGAAKGKIERFFRGYRDRFLTTESGFTSLQDLNTRTQKWIEDSYNDGQHRGIGMKPIERFNMDHTRIVYLNDDEYSEEAFFHEESRQVNKTNCIIIHKKTLECPAHLASKKVEVRFDRTRKNRYIVYYQNKRVGQATPIDLHRNADGIRKHFEK